MLRERTGQMSYFFLEKLDMKAVCACCGEEFKITPEWGWTYKNKNVCSYHCMRRMEREDPSSYIYREKHGEKKRRKENKPITPAEYAIIRMWQEGKSGYQIAQQMHVVTSTVYKYVEGVKRGVYAQKDEKRGD